MWQSSGFNLFQGPPPKTVTFCFGLWLIYQYRHSHWVWVDMWYYEYFHDNSVSQWLHLIKPQLQGLACPNVHLPCYISSIWHMQMSVIFCFVEIIILWFVFSVLVLFYWVCGNFIITYALILFVFVMVWNFDLNSTQKSPTELSSVSYMFFTSVWFFH